MKPERLYCVLDYETRSRASLRDVGSYEYARHPSTKIMCVAWRTGTRKTLPTAKTHVWSPFVSDGDIPEDLLDAFDNPECLLVAHNALFEQVITAYVLKYRWRHGVVLPVRRWICTASLAAALALPRSLEGAASALQLAVQKDMDGRRLLLKMAKPRKPTKADPHSEWHDNPEDFHRLMRYCVTDVDAETLLFLTCPPLIPEERTIWCLDQQINLTGFRVDRPLVATIRKLIAEEIGNLDRRTVELTGGKVESTRKVAALKNHLASTGLETASLNKETVSTLLKSGELDPAARELLQIRSQIGKTSTAKYDAFWQRSATDGRLRDILVYHGASPGRWSGAGVQPQNFPKGTLKDPITATEVLAGGDLEWTRMLYGDPMEVFSSCLRSMIIPESPEHVLDVADYNAVEVRVLFWVANHADGCRAFVEGRDLYCELGTTIYVKPITKEDTKERFVAKQAVIGSGYGLGWSRFQDYCESMGVPIDDDLAQRSISAYREVHKPVVRLWRNLERAAWAAVENPGKRYTINHTTWYVRDSFLWCVLPSGRRLAYHRPSVRYESTPWGGKQPVLYYYGVHPTKKKLWVKQRNWGGGLTENVVQAISRDLMACAMLRIRDAGWQLVLTVHDELVGECLRSAKHLTNERFCALMAELPPWAGGLPMKVEGWRGDRYRK